MSRTVKNIGVFTSGGDSPGMNACVRAVVRRALNLGLAVTGIRRGYSGMIDGDLERMNSRSVSNIIQQGGTILKSARSERFRTPEGRKTAFENLATAGVDSLIAIGGDGTLQGATIFQEEYGIPIVGCPGTIDNDLYGTDETIGFDTALNTALHSIDKIRDTADAHDRLFLIEVMGRDAGFIALQSSIGGGAELVLLPETLTGLPEVKHRILSTMKGKTRSSIVIVAEGDELGGAATLGRALTEDVEFAEIEIRVCILGHTQRGGSPTARDRVLASRLGAGAVDALVAGHSDVMVGMVGGKLEFTPNRMVWSRRKAIDMSLVDLQETLN